MSNEIPEPVRELLAAVLEAVEIPYPATLGDSEAYERIRATRTTHMEIAVRSALDGHPLGIEWTTEYLRERLAECPPTGYVTTDQVKSRLAEGRSWSEAVKL